MMVLYRLVTGLMDRLEHKLGREGIRTRVRTVASQLARTGKGKENMKENMKSPITGVSRPVGSPLEAARTENPPPVGNEIPRTPSIPRGEECLRSQECLRSALCSNNSKPLESTANFSSLLRYVNSI